MQLKNKWRDRLEGIFAILISLLIATRDIFDIHFSGSLVAGVIALMAYVMPYKKAVPFLFVSFPFTCGIPGYTVLLSYIVLLMKVKRVSLWQIMPPLILICLEFAHIGLLNANVNLVTSISFLSFVSLFFFLLFDSNENVDRRECVRMFIYGVVATLLIIYVSIIVHSGAEALLTPALRSSVGMGIQGDSGSVESIRGHLALNANSIAYFAITVFSLLLLGHKRLGIQHFIHTILVVLSILAGVFSFSRTWIMLFAALVLIYLIISQSKVKAFTIISLAILFVCILFPSVVISISDIFMGRFEDVETAGGRTDIFAVYNELWLSKISYIFFGVGAMCYEYIMDFDYSMHNGLQQIYVSYGIAGILLFLFVIRKYSRKYIAKKTPFIFYVPFLACFIFDQSIQFWDPYYLIFPFLAVAYVLRKEFVEQSNQVNLRQ